MIDDVKEASASAHLDQWAVGLAIVGDYPLVGAGQDSYVLLFGEYRDEVLPDDRRIAIAVDLSDESAYAVRWAVQNYLRPGDAVVLLHVRPTSVLYGADWGSIPVSVSDDADGEVAPAASAEELQKKREEDFDAFLAAWACSRLA